MPTRERTQERRCLVTRESRERDRLLRFVLDPERRVRFDPAERLPGRGMWLSADRDVVNRAVAKNLFAKAARGAATADSALADDVARLLRKRALDTLGLARRAGAVTLGFEQVRACLRAGRAAVVVTAADAAPEGRQKLGRLARDLPEVTAFTRAELGAALGRENIVHGALAPGPLARRLLRDVERLAGFEPHAVVWPATAPTPPDTNQLQETVGPR